MCTALAQITNALRYARETACLCVDLPPNGEAVIMRPGNLSGGLVAGKEDHDLCHSNDRQDNPRL